MAANIQDAIMLLGDSLTQHGWNPSMNGFAAQLAHAYSRKMDIVNRGFSGYNSEWIIPAFEQCFAAQHEQRHVPKVRLLTIWLGANDAALPPRAQHVPLPQFRANLHKLIHMVTSPTSPQYSPDTRIILFTPPPVNTYQWRAHKEEKTPPQQLDRDFETTRTYAEAVKSVAVQASVPVVDLWTRIWDACGREEQKLSEYLVDGLHLNGRGYAIVFEELMKSISKHYPELHYDNLQSVFVYFDLVERDPANYRTLVTKRDAFEKV